ncbi:MAG: hypothetical protein ABI954_06140 [Pyrinomonadaceae bacterium]
MKEDYLWDKTGTDPEIESLENALGKFCYQKTAPPLLPAKVFPFRKEPSRKIYLFALTAAAACLVFAVLGLGLWLKFSSNHSAGNLAEVVAAPNDAASANEPMVEIPNDLRDKSQKVPVIKKVKTSSKFTEEKFVRIRQAVPVIHYQTKAQNSTTTDLNARLTKEERYAYDQLMLALSITSSKLKLVKDKVEGKTEQTAFFKNAR